MLDKRLVNHTRHSLRTAGSQEELGENEQGKNDDDDLVDETNALIPGGRRRTGTNQNNPKYIYEARDKTMHKVEFEA